MTNVPRRAAVSRRTLLRAAGVAISLPMLDAMRPAFAAAAAASKPRRMVCIQTNMGILPQFFFPKGAGREYEMSPYLQRLAAHRNDLTVFSGVSHPGVTGAHAAEKCFLTGTPHPERGGFRNWISLDQVAAEQVGNQTRYPSLVLANSNEGNCTLSYTRSGAPIPAERSATYDPKEAFPSTKPDKIVERFDQLLRQASSHTLGVKSRSTIPREKLQKVEIPIAGLDCKACSLYVYELLIKQDGVEQATASFKISLATAWIDPEKTSRDKIIVALKAREVPVLQ